MSSVPTPEEAAAAARQAGLQYIDTSEPGFGRERRGVGFVYLDTEGRRITDAATLERIRRIVIPPAWTDVWISPGERGHIQATGRDSRGRKVYRYHEGWREVRDADKYAHLAEFAAALPRIRRRVAGDLGRPGVCRERVAAATVRLLESTLIRVGNDEYARDNRHYGLTTLRSRHLRTRGPELRFLFRGKGGVEHTVGISDRRVAGVMRRCQELPGQRLLQYLDDDGAARALTSGDVNDYLRTAAAADITAKDFRTWAGTVLGARELRRIGQAGSARGAERGVVAAVDAVARQLGNTRAVCRRCYIHPAVIDAYLDGSLVAALEDGSSDGSRVRGLRAEEAAVLSVLLRRRRAERRRRVA